MHENVCYMSNFKIVSWNNIHCEKQKWKMGYEIKTTNALVIFNS